MSRLSFLPACRLALGMLVGVAAHVQLHADDSIGVARISDRSQTVVRAQSPEDGAPAPISDTATADAAPIRQAQCAAEPGMNCPGANCPGNCPNGYVNGCPSGSGLNCPFNGGGHWTGETEFVSMSCPAHGGIYDPNCPDCRFYAQHGAFGNCPVPPGHSGALFFERCGKLFTGCGDKFFDMCGDMDGLFGKNTGQPLFGHYKIVYPVNPGYFDGRDGQVYAAQGYGGPVSVPLAPVVRNTYNYGWGVPSSRLTPISRPIPRGGRP